MSKEQNSRKEAKANRILIGVDVHLKSYQAAHKIDNGAEPRLGERRGLKHVADDQTRAAPRQPLAVREPRPTKFAMWYLVFAIPSLPR